jgi:hypothetical protein
MRQKKEAAVESRGAYDVDFFAWTQETAKLLERREFAQIDWEHVAEEIADMGKRDRREVRSRLMVLLMHLLKWEAQAERRRSSWRATIVEQGAQLVLLFEDSPSLRHVARDELRNIYRKAVQLAMRESRLSVEAFPKECPYNLEDLLSGELPK